MFFLVFKKKKEIRQEYQEKRIRQEFPDKKESGKKVKKKEPGKNVKKKKNQTRIQEHKNLAWRDNSCLASHDSVYMDLARKSRSVFSGKNLVQKEWQKNLD